MADMTKSKKVCEKCGLYQAYFDNDPTIYRVKWKRDVGIMRHTQYARSLKWIQFSECRQCDRLFEHLIESGKL